MITHANVSAPTIFIDSVASAKQTPIHLGSLISNLESLPEISSFGLAWTAGWCGVRARGAQEH